MTEMLERAARAVVDATLKQAKEEGFSVQGRAATHLTEVLAPKIALAVLTSLSDPTPECVEAMARATSLSRPWGGEPSVAKDYFRRQARASHAAFIRYVKEGK